MRDHLPVVLLGGGTVALSVARSLGPLGIPVHAVGVSEWEIYMGDVNVGSSRHCRSFTSVGPPEGRQARYMEWLSRCPVGEAAVFPCEDEALELIARNRQALVDLGYRPIEADDEVLLAMLDKERTYTLATAAGIGVPKRFVVEDAKTAEEQLESEGIGFPCALKPLHSHVFAQQFGARQKVFVAHEAQQLRDLLEDVERFGSSMMVTEIIPGPDDAYCSLYTYLDENGEPLFQFTKRKLRQFPIGFGMGTFHVTTRDEEVARVGLQFCQGVGVRGVAVPEFKRDERDGQLKLIECNHRFTLASEILRYAGLNLPLLAYRRLTGDPLPHFDGYRDGLHLWAPLPDLRAFREYREAGQMSTREWLGGLCHNQRFPLFDPTDPGPSAKLLLHRARRLVQGTGQRLRPGRSSRDAAGAWSSS